MYENFHQKIWMNENVGTGSSIEQHSLYNIYLLVFPPTLISRDENIKDIVCQNYSVISDRYTRGIWSINSTIFLNHQELIEAITPIILVLYYFTEFIPTYKINQTSVINKHNPWTWFHEKKNNNQIDDMNLYTKSFCEKSS